MTKNEEHFVQFEADISLKCGLVSEFNKEVISIWNGYLKKLKLDRDVLFEFLLKVWNTASICIPVRSLL